MEQVFSQNGKKEPTSGKIDSLFGVQFFSLEQC